MVNAKGVAFRVNKQTPISQPPRQAYGTVINCRKVTGKRALKEQKDVPHYVAFTSSEATLKRKWGEKDPDAKATSSFIVYQSPDTTHSSETPPDSLAQKWQSPKPPRVRKLKLPSKGVDLDCWFTILSFSDPAQLLLMRSKIPSCYHFLSKNPMLWRHSRNYHYGSDLPEPPSGLTEYQYADLRHDHGCMSCKAPNTRKTYWAFLRRWCKTCLNSKTEKEHDAVVALRDAYGEESMVLQKCLPSGIFDSWGNFVGVGPATTHALKTVYLISDVKALVAEYGELKAKNVDLTAWPAEFSAWFKAKTDTVEERKVFAHKMESWEEMMRNDRSCEYSAKKAARKRFFQQKASELSPALSLQELECCPAYKRAILIPKEPNNTSWLQLKPKLEKEAAELRAKGGPPETSAPASSASGTSTPIRTMEPPHAAYRFPMGFPMGLPSYTPPSIPSQNHGHIQLPPQSHVHVQLPSQSHGHIQLPPLSQIRQGLPPLPSRPAGHMMLPPPNFRPTPPNHFPPNHFPPNHFPREFTGLPLPHSHMF